MSERVAVVWDDGFLGYDLGDHPLNPVRLELTMELARQLGILDRPNVIRCSPQPADDALLQLVHDRTYVEAVRAAASDPHFTGFGLNTQDNPVFAGIHAASALVVGGTVLAAEQVWAGEVEHGINIAGGLHHAMRDHASGFCVYNDPAIAIRRLLDMGATKVAYVDVDVHHGDGVQAAFWDDPRVLTVSVHQSPYSLFPGTGFPDETGGAGAPGSAVNLALPPGTGDEGWLRAFHAVVPDVLRAFGPEVLVSQCGCDTHSVDPLAALELSVDGHRASYFAMHEWAHQLCGGRWVVTGGGGYGLVNVVPRSWTHLLAEVTGEPIPPNTLTPEPWREFARSRRPGTVAPVSMTDRATAGWTPWTPAEVTSPVDQAILATRGRCPALVGLDPAGSSS
ncbi:MAG: acetoin utilization protein AcuC [Actinobacteria bacterium]|nr:acetoin utilization protein AcuC [Actinomycetota bacterium]